MRTSSNITSHAQLQGVTSGQHHAQLHAAQHELTGNDVAGPTVRNEKRIQLSADFVVVNNATPASVTDFTWDLVAGTTYGIRFWLQIAQGATGGVKTNFLITNSAEVAILGGASIVDNGQVGVCGIITLANRTNSFNTLGNMELMEMEVVFSVNATCQVKFQFSQANATPAGSLTLKAGSYGELHRYS